MKGGKVIVLVMTMMIIIIVGGCDNSADKAGMTPAVTSPVIEKGHIYESAQLQYVLPSESTVIVTLMQDTGKVVDGHPDDLLWKKQITTDVITIEKNPEWFSKEQTVKWFALEVHNRDSMDVTWTPFFWLSPNYTLSEHTKMFEKTARVIYESFDAYDAGRTGVYGISIFFAQRGTLQGVWYKTRINDKEYILKKVSSDNPRHAYMLVFNRFGSGSSVVEISAIMMTEFGDHEGPITQSVTIPYTIDDPVHPLGKRMNSLKIRE